MWKTSKGLNTKGEHLVPKYRRVAIEEYVEIPGYPKYEVSNTGNVRSKDYKYVIISSGVEKNCFHKGRVLKKDIGKKGYVFVRIGSSPVWKRIGIHRLVCAGFLGLDLNNSKQFACHKNDVPYDNRVENLYVGDSKTNVRDMRDRGRCTIDNRGERNGMSKLTYYDVKDIRDMRSIGINREYISIKYGIHKDYVSKLTGNGKRKCWESSLGT